MTISLSVRRKLIKDLTDTLAPFFATRISAAKYARRVVKDLTTRKDIGAVISFYQL